MTPGSEPARILYLNTNFVRKMRSQAKSKEVIDVLRTFYRNDIVFVPAFVNNSDERSVRLVELNVPQLKVDLYDRERDEQDTSEFSDMVIEMLRTAYRLQDKELNEEDIDGGVEQAFVPEEEDMITVACYVAERRTFGMGSTVDDIDIEHQRNRIVDYFVHLLVVMGAYEY